jgi:hypothetical protein
MARLMAIHPRNKSCKSNNRIENPAAGSVTWEQVAGQKHTTAAKDND